MVLLIAIRINNFHNLSFCKLFRPGDGGEGEVALQAVVQKPCRRVTVGVVPLIVEQRVDVTPQTAINKFAFSEIPPRSCKVHAADFGAFGKEIAFVKYEPALLF